MLILVLAVCAGVAVLGAGIAYLVRLLGAAVQERRAALYALLTYQAEVVQAIRAIDEAEPWDVPERVRQARRDLSERGTALAMEVEALADRRPLRSAVRPAGHGEP